jgi:Zn-dependent protease
MIEQLLFIPVLIFSIVVHECAHGIAALRAGDPTAKLMGRITLNPLPHIDPIGSILLPGLLILTNSSFLFGWAKPVPVNPANFRDRRRDEIRVSFAGPFSNLVLSLLFLLLTILIILLYKFLGLPDSSLRLYYSVLRSGIIINLVLAFFNLIPVPPLDGSHILENLLPYSYRQFFYAIRPYGFFILLLIIMTPLANLFFWPVRVLWGLYSSIIGLFL